ncbi:hypothetical protein [uncultured Varibaculum sp.]|uniref:hypothetical protein n=1 Tax=uncultured Varibaculum sp. TaxID=413896 RepID=UPI002592857D|nr:hypothetical protein [uncultured Varibaculum sp.]
MNDFFDLNCFLLDPERQLPKEASKDHVRTWLEYKIDVLKDNEGRKVKDPDASKDARKFYEKIWKDFLEESGLSLRPEASSLSKNPEQYVQGDWMCSVATTFGKGLSVFVNGDKELKNLFRNKFPKKKLRGGVGGYNTYAEILIDDMKSDEQKFQKFWGDEVVQNFIRSAYTFANLIIVPYGFNAARDTLGEDGTEDYWDLTLKKFYQDKEPLTSGGYDLATPFRKLLKKNQEQGDPLFLSPWIDEQGNPILLPDSPRENKANWRSAMAEMTTRIDCRRELMAQYIDQLQNE